MDGRGFLEVLPVSLPQGPGCLPYVLLIATYFPTLVTVDYTTLLLGSWSFGLTNSCLKVMLPLKFVWMPYLLQIFLILSPSPWVYGMTMCPMLGLSLLKCLPSVLALELLVPCTGLLSLVTVVTIILSVPIYKLTLNLMYGPPGVFALDQSLP